jgi:hypothetical protein
MKTVHLLRTVNSVINWCEFCQTSQFPAELKGLPRALYKQQWFTFNLSSSFYVLGLMVFVSSELLPKLRILMYTRQDHLDGVSSPHKKSAQIR